MEGSDTSLAAIKNKKEVMRAYTLLRNKVGKCAMPS